MVAHREGKQLVNQVFKKVIAAQVGKLVHNHGAKIGCRQSLNQILRQQNQFPREPHRHGTKDAGRHGKRHFADSKPLRAPLPIRGGFTAKRHFPGFPAHHPKRAQPVDKSGREIDRECPIRNRD